MDTIDLKYHFKRGEWDKMSELERTRHTNMFEAYKDCINRGMNIDFPNFIMPNDTVKKGILKKRNNAKGKRNKRVKFKFPLKSLPKRQKKIVNYKEAEELEPDAYIYCDDCQEVCEHFCSRCGMLLHVFDNEVRKGVKNRAKRTLPKDILEIKKSKIHGEGVFTLKSLPKGLKFGPYEGLQTVDSTTGYAWKIRGGKLIDAFNVEYSNWMRFVNCARNVSEQNVFAFQYEGKLYYRTVREINVGDELLVFYGDQFAKMLNIDTRTYYKEKANAIRNEQTAYFQPEVEKESRNVYACLPCCLGFNSELVLRQHLAKCPFDLAKKNISKDIVPCPFCKIYLSNAQYLQRHIKYCREKYNRKNGGGQNNGCDLRNENDDDHSTGRVKKRFQCSHCFYKTNQFGDFKRHQLTHNNVKPFSCDICEKRFSLKHHLKTHILIHTGEKPFKCTYCDHATNTKGYLNHHMNQKHLKIKQFACQYCEYKSTKKGNLIVHLETHSSERSFECDVCKKTFIQDLDLKRHLNVHFAHRPYHCRICEQKFTQNSNLKQHLLIHTNKRDFQCHICNKTFRRNSNLKVHLAVHSDIKKYKCSICDYGANVKQSLTLHFISKHS